MKIEIGQKYKDGHGKQIMIAGRVKFYSAAQPFVWSIAGDWYHEQTGQFVTVDKSYNRGLAPEGSLKNICEVLND